MAAVGRVAITASDCDEEYRLEYFLEQGRAPQGEPDQATLERVRDQLINQELLEREAVSDGATAPDGARGEPAELTAVRKKYASSEDFRAALRGLGMDESQFAARLAARERSLRVIDQHLRPLATVESQDIENYYRHTFLTEFAKRGEGTAPALAEVEHQIREILVQRKINQTLPSWLASLRASHRVEVYPWP